MQLKTNDLFISGTRKDITKKFDILLESNLLSSYLKSCSQKATTDLLEIEGKNKQGKTVKVAGSSDNIEAMIVFKRIVIVTRITYSKSIQPLTQVPSFYNN